jgi:hypothetical protein
MFLLFNERGKRQIEKPAQSFLLARGVRPVGENEHALADSSISHLAPPVRETVKKFIPRAFLYLSAFVRMQLPVSLDSIGRQSESKSRWSHSTLPLTTLAQSVGRGS